MVKYIMFMDYVRQQEIETFFEACQKHRNYYKGNPRNYHPLSYFEEREYRWQCPSEMTTAYLTYPLYHVKYKQPSVLPHSTGRTSGIPALPDRTLVARFKHELSKFTSTYCACQRHRSFYKGEAGSLHPLIYFSDPQYMWQCPPEMTPTYLGYPPSYVRYKQPVALAGERGRTSGFPSLPGRSLAGRYNNAACKAYVR